MAYGTVNADVIGTSVANSNIGAGNASLMKNRIINGAMVISQYNGTSSVTPTATAYVIDRWQALISQASKLSFQQNAGSVATPVGFNNYLGATSLSAYTVGATDYFTITQKIEGFNTADLGWGTANAKTVTVSFQVYSSLTGNFGLVLRNSASTRCYPVSYSIPVANTWTTISITIAGDTTGTWIGATNGIGIELDFGLGVGSTYSGASGAWSGTSYLGVTGATSVVGTNGATFYITGVQLEVGSSATGFEYRHYQQELALCQRYCNVFGGDSANTQITTTQPAQSTTGMGSNAIFSVDMRAIPTMTYSALSDFNITNNVAAIVITAMSIYSAGSSKKQAAVQASCASGLTQFYPYYLATANTNARLTFSAEL